MTSRRMRDIFTDVSVTHGTSSFTGPRDNLQHVVAGATDILL